MTQRRDCRNLPVQRVVGVIGPVPPRILEPGLVPVRIVAEGGFIVGGSRGVNADRRLATGRVVIKPVGVAKGVRRPLLFRRSR